VAEERNKDFGADEEELAAYEKLLQRVSRRFSELNEKLTSETVGRAIDKAMADLREKGEHSREVIARAGETLRKDIASTTEHIRPRIDKVTEPAREQFDRWLNKGGALWHGIANEAAYYKEFSRDKSGAFLYNITKGLNDWSSSLADRLNTSLQYKTGEMTHGGEFVCTSCESRIHLRKPGRIPPCPKCSHSEFRRS
jgi:hypothetical protein